MKAMIKKDARQEYLVFEGEAPYREDYRFHMLLSNHIPGILPCNVRSVDDKARFYYEITRKHSLRKELAEHRASREIAERLISGILAVDEVCAEYLLDMQNIILLPEYIYLDDSKMYFCYFPLWSANQEKAFHKLTEELLRLVDPTDQDTIQYIFRLHQVTEGEYHLQDIPAELKGSAEQTVTETEQVPLYQSPVIGDFSPEQPEKPRLWERLLFWRRRRQREEEEDDLWEDPATTLLVPSSPETLLLTPDRGGESIAVNGASLVIGSSRNREGGGIRNSAVSRTHAQITRLAGTWFLEDLHSTNGTFHNGRRVDPGERVELAPGDHVAFANEGYRVTGQQGEP